MSEGEDYYGADAQKAVLQRGRAVYDVVARDPRFTYYGRGVGLATEEDADDATVRSLLTLQGTTTLARVAAHKMDDVANRMDARGIALTRYECWVGEGAAFDAASDVIDATALPTGLTLHRIGPDSPPSTLDALQALAASCGVMLPNMAVLRGTLRPGACFVALTEKGEAVSCGAAAAFAHPDHQTMGREAWWGMLATADAWRGKRLALLLGAHAMRALKIALPDCYVMTGVQPGNGASEAVCAKLGLRPDGASVATLVDPAALPGGKLTS